MTLTVALPTGKARGNFGSSAPNDKVTVKLGSDISLRSDSPILI